MSGYDNELVGENGVSAVPKSTQQLPLWASYYSSTTSTAALSMYSHYVLPYDDDEESSASKAKKFPPYFSCEPDIHGIVSRDSISSLEQPSEGESGYDTEESKCDTSTKGNNTLLNKLQVVRDFENRLKEVETSNPAKLSEIISKITNDRPDLHFKVDALLREKPKFGPGRSLLTMSTAKSSSDSLVQPANSRSEKWETRGRNWNDEFQRLWRLVARNNDEDAVGRLSALAVDFVDVARQYGRVIVSERYLPDCEKSIVPLCGLGFSGGEKYVCQGILFKFAVDVDMGNGRWLYGGSAPRDDLAMKGAANELKGSAALFSTHVRGLSVPLLCTIDYRGFRLIAAALLPIDGENTLRYGSSDGGRTVRNSDPVIAHRMRVAAAALNLAPHLVHSLSGDGSAVTLHGPADVEVHVGSDGRAYALDCARLMPPEAPPEEPDNTFRASHVFLQQLRPELVRAYHVPLSSDAFSRFGAADPHHRIHNHYVRSATRHLHDVAIPECARSLTQLNMADVRLVQHLHANGVNCRHLGSVRKAYMALGVANGGANHHAVLLLTEMVARCIKTSVRTAWRQSLQRTRVPSLATDRETLSDIVAPVFGDSGAADAYWCVTVKRQLREKFAEALREEEYAAEVDLRNELVDLRLLRNRVEELAFVRLPSAADNEVVIDSRVKHLNIIGYTTVAVLRAQAQSARTRPKFERLFKDADRLIAGCLQSTPAEPSLWHEWGLLLHARAKFTGRMSDYDDALKKLRRARVHSATHNEEVGATVTRSYVRVLADAAFSAAEEAAEVRTNARGAADATRGRFPPGAREAFLRTIQSLEFDANSYITDAIEIAPDFASRALLENCSEMWKRRILSGEKELLAAASKQNEEKFSFEDNDTEGTDSASDNRNGCDVSIAEQLANVNDFAIYARKWDVVATSVDAEAYFDCLTFIIGAARASFNASGRQRGTEIATAFTRYDLQFAISGMAAMNVERLATQRDVEFMLAVVARLEEAVGNAPDRLGKVESLIRGSADSLFARVFCMYRTDSVVESTIVDIAQQVTKLDLTGLCGLPEAALLTLWRECCNLESLNLRRIRTLSTEVVIQLAKRGSKKLSSLVLAECRLMTDAALSAIALHLPNLVVLDISHLPGITDVGVSNIALHCRNLTRFRAHHVPTLSDVSMVAIVTNCANIREILISHCLVTDAFLAALSANATLLERLKIDFCLKISAKAILQFAKRRENSLILSIDGLELSERTVSKLLSFPAGITLFSEGIEEKD